MLHEGTKDSGTLESRLFFIMETTAKVVTTIPLLISLGRLLYIGTRQVFAQ